MIEIIEKTNDRIKLKTDMPFSLANALRRSVNYIPILAIDTLEISKNDSALYDEIVAHRAGLVPLKNEKLKINCDCGKEDGCGKCSIKLKLSAVGPTTVYSTDLLPKGSSMYKIPLVILGKDQELEFVALAKMGRGIEHAKFSPGAIFYNYEEKAEDDDEEFKKIVEEAKKKENKELEMNVESWGQISAKEMFIEAAETLNEEMRELVKKLK